MSASTPTSRSSSRDGGTRRSRYRDSFVADHDDNDEDDCAGLLSKSSKAKFTRRYSLDCMMDGSDDPENLWSTPMSLVAPLPSKVAPPSPASPCPTLGTPQSTPSSSTKTKSKVLNVMSLMRNESPSPPTTGYRGPVHEKKVVGVRLWEGSAPLQSDGGNVSAEVEDPSREGSPIVVQFCSPWSLKCISKGLEVGRRSKPDSAFVHVISSPSVVSKQTKKLANVVLDQVLKNSGKFVNSSISSVKCKSITSGDLLLATFTCATEKGSKPLERRMFLKLKWVHDSTMVVLAVHTTASRFGSKERSMLEVANSLVAY